MQYAGTLRKRRRRNLTKVRDLTNEQFFDNGDGGNATKDSDNSTVVNISSLEFTELRKKSGGLPSSRTRPTRNPMFYREPEAAFGIDDKNSEYPSSKNIEGTKASEEKENTFIKANDRPYLFDSLTMFCLKLIVFVGQKSGAMPWKWDSKSHKYKKWSPKYLKMWKIFRAFSHIQTACLTLYQIHIFWGFASSGNYSNREIFMASFGMTCNMCYIGYAIHRYMHEDQVREYINTLFKFNYEMVNKYAIDLSGYNYSFRLITNFVTLATLNNILWFTINFLQMPYAPWYLTSYIYPKPWYWLIPGVIQTCYMCGQMLSTDTLGFWVIIAHTSTVQFWLSEAHKNNPSDYTSDEIRKQKTSLEVYKSLQVLNSLFNDCISPVFFPIVIMVVLSVDVVAGYIIIRSMNSLFDQDLSQFIVYPTAFLVTSIQGFTALTMSAMMYDLGISFIDSWSSTPDKDFRKTLSSCEVIKAYVRTFYFITVSTTVNFFQIVFGNIVDVVISFP